MTDKPKVVIDLNEGRCTCGCGQETKPKSRFRPGHDQRTKGNLKRAHQADQKVTLVEGKTRRQVTAREAASRLDNDRYSWSGALTPPVVSETEGDITGGQDGGTP